MRIDSINQDEKELQNEKRRKSLTESTDLTIQINKVFNIYPQKSLQTGIVFLHCTSYTATGVFVTKTHFWAIHKLIYFYKLA